MRKIIFTTILFFSVLLMAQSLNAQTPLTNAPDFTAIDARGNYHRLYDYLSAGKYVVLDFFYNECLVCQEHVPEVNDAYVQFGCNTSDVVFIGVNFDNTDGEVIAFENAFGLFYPNISGTEGGGNNIITLFQVIAFPTIILIAPDGSIPLQDMWPLTAVNIIDEVSNEGPDTAACPYLSTPLTIPQTAVSIFPNPASDFINIATGTGIPSAQITITDITGKIVLDANYTDFHKTRINSTTFPKGLYFITIMGEQGLYRHKIAIE